MFRRSFILLFLLVVVGCNVASDTQEEIIAKEEVIRITADSIGWDGKLPCQITYAGKKYSAEIKFRGGVSSKYPKHSMTVEFDEHLSIGGLPKNDDWIFNASYIDKTFQRHKLSYDLFRAMSSRNMAPQCTYLPMYLNDKYIGLYVVMEKVNGSWFGFNKKKPKGARLFKDPFVFVEERLPNVQEPDNYYQQKFPKINSKDCNHELDAFKQFLFSSDDATFLKEYKNWIDEKSLIDWHLLLLLTNNDDGIIKNFYLYKTPNDQRLKFVPWDYDHSFGRDGNYELNLIEREVGWEKVILLERLMRLSSSGYSKQLKKRYLEVRSSVFTQSFIFKLIAKNDEALRPFIQQNAQAWPLDAKWYSDANDYEQEIEIIKQYIPLRLNQLDTFFNTLDYGEEEKS